MTTRRQGNQPHIPRLTYRNAPSTLSVDNHSIRTVGTQSSTASQSTCATSPSTSSIGGSPRWCRFSDDVLSPLSLDGVSDPRPSSSFLSPHTVKESKKKSSSVFKFFSVKEPSTQAFEAYQEQMKKRGTTQTGRANAVGLPGVSSAKLPPTVPKVNSKWDGVPQAAKEKVKEKDNPSRSSFASSGSRPLYTSRSYGSTMTTATMSSTSSTRSDLRANGSLRLDSSSGNLADLYGWEVPPPATSIGTPIPLESKGGASAAPTLQRERTSFFPQSPSVLATAYESPAETPPPLDPPSNRPSPLVLPSLPTPPTPNDSAPCLPWSSANSISDPSLPTNQPSQVGNAAVILNSAGPNVLGPPVSATPRAGSAPFAAGEATEFVLPSTGHGRPSSPGQPNPILKAPSDFSIEPSLKPAAVTKSRRMQMKSLFSKDT
ncbi:MAG: hypothetical protein LQ337_008177 [Flavoplaca oasis]|nr:MAG: hypothetical protein LQ337_008177 [Flavoplaca oasis]